MKSILLASASVVAFAGAAAADGHAGIGFGGSATLGYNNDIDGGFYYDANVGVTMTAALDNGLTAQATFDFDVADAANGIDLNSGNYALSLSSDMATLSFGDVDPVADAIWSGVSGGAASFNDYDAHTAAGFEAVLRGDVMYNNFNVYASFGVDADGANDNIGAMQLAATGTFGQFGVIAAFQEEFGGADANIGLAATAAFAGADIKVAYETNGTDNSYGASVSYPVGPVTLGAFFTANDATDGSYGVSADYASGPIGASAAYESDDGSDSATLDVTYDVGNGITALAGVDADLTNSETAYYVAGSVDLGGGASFLMSFAEDSGNATNDEIGGPEYKTGITAELSFSF